MSKKIRFLKGFQGRLTNEQWFPEGAVVEHPNAAALVQAGRAEYVDEEPDLSEMDLDVLREYAYEQGLTYARNMKRETILERLKE